MAEMKPVVPCLPSLVRIGHGAGGREQNDPGLGGGGTEA